MTVESLSKVTSQKNTRKLLMFAVSNNSLTVKSPKAFRYIQLIQSLIGKPLGRMGLFEQTAVIRRDWAEMDIAFVMDFYPDLVKGLARDEDETWEDFFEHEPYKTWDEAIVYACHQRSIPCHALGNHTFVIKIH